MSNRNNVQQEVGDLLNNLDEGESIMGAFVSASGRLIDAYYRLDDTARASQQGFVAEYADHVAGLLDETLEHHPEPANPIDSDSWAVAFDEAFNVLTSLQEGEIGVGVAISRLGDFIDAIDRLPEEDFRKYGKQIDQVFGFVKVNLENVGSPN